MAQLNFDATQVAPNSGTMDPIPAGWYNALIDQSEMKPTKDGTGSYLELRFNVIDGQYANRKIFARLNLRNSNAQAQEIAYGELSAICHATGVLHLQDSQQVHGIPMKIKVKLRSASGDYEASNEITGFKNINEQVGTPAGAPVGGGAPAGGVPAGFANQAPQQAPTQQPWQQPAQQPQAQTWQQPAPQQAPMQQPQVAPQQQVAQQPWQQPQAQQPWQQTAAQAPVEQAQAPVQQAAPQQAPVQQSPQMQQQAPQQGAGMPPWAQGGQ